MPNLAEFTRRWRTGPTTLIESPVRDSGPRPEIVALSPRSRRRIVLVSRLVEPFKGEGILRAITAMNALGGQDLVLEIVGDGPARPLFEEAAESVNQQAKTAVIEFLGEHLDGYAAIAAADLVVGNGLSVIQGVMMGKPSVVVGREGYSVVVDSGSLPELIDRGFYGVGEGLKLHDPLPEQILAALSEWRKAELAALADQVRDRYGLHAVVPRFEAELDRAREIDPPGAGELSRSLARAVHYRARRRILRRRANRLGLTAEINDDYVFGRLRNMALPPASWGTGHNQPVRSPEPG
jgi:glycosyltransferase involved in cell wall biosynthesis